MFAMLFENGGNTMKDLTIKGSILNWIVPMIIILMMFGIGYQCNTRLNITHPAFYIILGFIGGNIYRIMEKIQ